MTESSPHPSPTLLRRDADARMVVLVARAEDTFEAVMTALLDAGVSGATVIESRGLGAVLRTDLPIFTGLAALLPGDSGSRMIVSFCTRAHVETLLRHLSAMPVDQRPVGAVIPVDGFFGFEP